LPKITLGGGLICS